jgi:hypothetical protein
LALRRELSVQGQASQQAADQSLGAPRELRRPHGVFATRHEKVQPRASSEGAFPGDALLAPAEAPAHTIQLRRSVGTSNTLQ